MSWRVRSLGWLAFVCVAAPCAFGEEPTFKPIDVSLNWNAAVSPGVTGFSPLGELDLNAEAMRGAQRKTTRQGFMQRHMLPRMTRQLLEVAPVHSLEVERGAFEQSGMHLWVSGTVQERALRGTRKAVRDYLLSETALAGVVESFRLGRHGIGRPHTGQALDFGVGASHGTPQFEMRHRSSAGTLRVNLGLSGSAGLEFRPSSGTHARFYAGYESPNSQYVLSYRYGF